MLTEINVSIGSFGLSGASRPEGYLPAGIEAKLNFTCFELGGTSTAALSNPIVPPGPIVPWSGLIVQL